MKFTVIFLTLLVSVYTKPLELKKDDLIKLSNKLNDIQQDLSSIEVELHHEDDIPKDDKNNFDDLEYQSDDLEHGHHGSGLKKSKGDDQAELFNSLAQLDSKLAELNENLKEHEKDATKEEEDYIEETPNDTSFQSLEEQLDADLEDLDEVSQKDQENQKEKEKDDMEMKYYAEALKLYEEEMAATKDELAKLSDARDEKDHIDHLEDIKTRLNDLKGEIKAHIKAKADQKAAHAQINAKDEAEDTPEEPTEQDNDESKDVEIIKNELGDLPSADARTYSEALNMFENEIKSVKSDLEKSNDDSPSAKADQEDKKQQLKSLEKQLNKLKDEIDSRIKSRADHLAAVANNNQENKAAIESDMNAEDLELEDEAKDVVPEEVFPFDEKKYQEEEQKMEDDEKDSDMRYYEEMLKAYEDEMSQLKADISNDEAPVETKEIKKSELVDLKKRLHDLQDDINKHLEKKADESFHAILNEVETPVKDEIQVQKEKQIEDINSMIDELSSLKDYLRKDQKEA